jgi:hypothetical protein
MRYKSPAHGAGLVTRCDPLLASMLHLSAGGVTSVVTITTSRCLAAVFVKRGDARPAPRTVPTSHRTVGKLAVLNEVNTEP